MQGWIDITYLSQDGTLRLTRGNKGNHRALLDPVVSQVLPSNHHALHCAVHLHVRHLP